MTEIITEVDFISPCPVQQCVNKQKSYRWIHTDCGGREKLNDEGNLRCLKCGKVGPFIDWKFNCGDHDYEKASAQGIAHALAVMAQIAVDKSQQKFIAKTTAAIMNWMIKAQMSQ
jgi:hypothetical protein